MHGIGDSIIGGAFSQEYSPSELLQGLLTVQNDIARVNLVTRDTLEEFS